MSPHRLELISTAEMYAIDAASVAAGVPVSALMGAAGESVAAAIAERFEIAPVLVVCGPGNNGGDGWVAASALKRRGWQVRVLSLAPAEKLSADAAAARAHWDGPVESVWTPGGAILFVDAMFGAGLSRPLDGIAAEIARFMAEHRRQVIAVDAPSGLSGDTGKPIGEACAAAALTVTFVRKKPAHLLYPGRDLCGEVALADIGAPERAITEIGVKLWENQPDLWRAHFPWPAANAHKHRRGHVLAASGGQGRSGAARLGARAALRAGAGLVTVLAPGAAMAECAAQLTAIMLRQADAAADLVAASGEGILLIGPGFGLDPERVETLLATLRARAGAGVLDADALTALAGARADWPNLIRAEDVLTPHQGEFERLFPGLLANSASRVEAVRRAALEADCVVLLKGPDTAIAAPDGRAAINPTGSPFLATAGAGDVLAGAIAGLAAQGMPAFEAACAGAWLHGRAGEALGPGLIAEDLSEAFPSILKRLAQDQAR